jgi:hypothetical protein
MVQMAAKRQRRKYTTRPGLTEAAAALQCTYSHLRRVILGERPSSLLAKYRALQSSQSTTNNTKKTPK